MAATDRTLRQHGYADLSIAKIADEAEMSKSALYYHYEDKDDLLVAFLDHVVDRFLDDVAAEEDTDPEATLRSFIDRLLPPSLDEEGYAFYVALFELRSQAPHNPAYRERFTETDRLLRETLAEHLERGIDQGRFRSVDPDATAQLLVAAIAGGMVERVTTDGEDPAPALRAGLDAYIGAHVLAESP